MIDFFGGLGPLASIDASRGLFSSEKTLIAGFSVFLPSYPLSLRGSPRGRFTAFRDSVIRAAWVCSSQSI
jgi:hypothetical protein